MAVQYRWFDEIDKDIVIITPDHNWTWAEFDQVKEELDAMISKLEQPVYYIADHTNAPLMPTGKQSGFIKFSQAFETAPPNIKHFYVVGARQIVQIIMRTMKRVSFNLILSSMTMVRTVDEAVADIRIRQQKLAKS